MKYAVKDEQGNVYGIGATEKAALKDAAQWIDRDSDVNRLITEKISDKLADYINEHGGSAKVIRAFYKKEAEKKRR